jgi:hypothetical protein
VDAESIVDALLEVGTSRRSFLKTVGAGLTAAAFAPASAVGSLAQSAAKVATPARRSGGFFFYGYDYGLDAAGRGVISNDGVNYRYADNGEPARLAEPAKRQKQKAQQAPQQKATVQQQVHGRSERDLPMQRMPESLDDDDLKSFARETPRWYTARGSRTDAFIHSYLRVTRDTENAIHGDLYFLWVDGPKRGDFERVGETYIKKDYPEDWVPATGREARRVVQMFKRLQQESIAVDLDGTLARDSGWKGPEHIGKPIKPMLDLVQKLLDDGEEVVIFTARCHDGKSSTKDYVKQWLKDNGLPDLEVTNEKRPDMEKFYDDKAVEVETNKGVSE